MESRKEITKCHFRELGALQNTSGVPVSQSRIPESGNLTTEDFQDMLTEPIRYTVL